MAENELGEWPPIKMGEIGIKLMPSDVAEVVKMDNLFVLEPDPQGEKIVSFWDGAQYRALPGWLRKVGGRVVDTEKEYVYRIDMAALADGAEWSDVWFLQHMIDRGVLVEIGGGE